MKRGLFRRLFIITIVLIIIILFASQLTRYVKSVVESDGIAEIVMMDSDLKQMLGQRYRLYLNNDIIFIEGYYETAFQDNSVYLSIKVPNSYLYGFYDREHYKETTFADGNETRKRLEYDGELYTHIDFYDADGEYTIVKFWGRYPGSMPGIMR